MVTLRQLFTQFGHDATWTKFATASMQPMVSVYLRKLGERDVSSLSDFDLSLQLTMSEQPQERKVKAEACMRHMLRWAEQHGLTDIPSMKHTETTPSVAKSEPKPKEEPKIATDKPKTKPHKATARKAKPAVKKRAEPKPKPRKCRGTVYHDTASKGDIRAGKRRAKDCWRAEITIDGKRFRHRGADRQDCEQWLKAVRTGKIKPTDNKADWWRMEQRKDEAVRIDEIIVNAAEESVMLYDYHQTGDITAINDYIMKRLLPHMAYYCAHTLNFGKDRTITASRQAIALLLTRITAGKPVMNFTATCKRMLRVHKQRGDFFYYENAPEPVRLMVNRIDMSALADVWKVTKDRRL